MRARRRIGTVRGSYPEPRPAGNEGRPVHALDDHQLLPVRRPGDDPDIASRDLERVGQALEQCRVRRAFHGRRGHPHSEYAIEDALDPGRGGSRREPDGEPDVGGAQDLRTRA